MGEFSKRLRQIMEERGMRQIDLSAASGIERSLISSYLAGRHEPKDDKLQASSGWSSQATMKETYWGEINEESKAQMAKFNKCVDSEFFGI